MTVGMPMVPFGRGTSLSVPMPADRLTGLTGRVRDAVLSCLDTEDLFALAGVSRSWRHVVLDEHTWTGRGCGAAWRELAVHPHMAAMARLRTARNMTQRAVGPVCEGSPIRIARCLYDGRLLIQRGTRTDALQLVDPADMRVVREMPVPPRLIDIILAPTADRAVLVVVHPDTAWDLDLVLLDVRTWSLTLLFHNALFWHGSPPWPCPRHLFSPDGRSCAVFERFTSDDRTREAVCVNADAGADGHVAVQHVRLGFTAAETGGLDFISSVWSPDSSKIAVCCIPDHKGPLRVRCVDVRTGAAHTTPLGVDSSHPSCSAFWDPHSSRVVVTAAGRLFIVDADEHPQGPRLTRVGDDIHLSRLSRRYAWAPGGRWLWMETKSGFHKVEVDTGAVVLSHHVSTVGTSTWAHDASHVAHGIADDNDEETMWVTSFRGEESPSIKCSQTYLSHWLVSPDGRTAVCIHWRSGISVYELTPEADPRLRVHVDTLNVEDYPTWCPDSTHIAYVSYRHRYIARTLYILDTRTGHTRALCSTSEDGTVHFEWAAHGGVLAALDQERAAMGDTLTVFDFRGSPFG